MTIIHEYLLATTVSLVPCPKIIFLAAVVTHCYYLSNCYPSQATGAHGACFWKLISSTVPNANVLMQMF